MSYSPEGCGDVLRSPAASRRDVLLAALCFSAGDLLRALPRGGTTRSGQSFLPRSSLPAPAVDGNSASGTPANKREGDLALARM